MRSLNKFRFNRNKSFIILISIGLIVRIAIMLYSFQFRENPDILRWRDWGRIAYLHDLGSTYKTDYLTFGTYSNNMPPGTLYIVSFMYNMDIQTSKVIIKILNAKEGSILWINTQLLNLFLRITGIFADLAISFLIYKIVKSERSQKKALFASSIFLFNPVVIYNSSFWGQMDSINNLLFLVSLFFLFRKSFFLSTLLMFLSLYVKLSLIFFLPLLIYYIYDQKKINLKNSLRPALSIFFSFVAILILTIPISPNPIMWFTNFLSKNSFGEMNNITNFALNFWWMIFKPWIKIGDPINPFSFSEIRLLNSPYSDIKYFGIPLMLYALFLFFFFFLIIFYKILSLKKDAFSKSNILLYLSLTSQIAFLFLPGMHERYMYPIFPLLAVYIGLKTRYLWAFVSLSILNLINLYLVWHPMLAPVIPYQAMNSANFQWILSVITVFASMLFFAKLVLPVKNEKI